MTLRRALAIGRSLGRFALARSRFSILMYHRVVTRPDGFFPGIPVERFARQLAFLKRCCAVLSLGSALDLLSRGKQLPRRAVCLTFDDGYRSAFTHAFSLLRRLHLPATVFLTTGAIDRSEPLWFDALALLVRGSRGPALTVSLGGVERRFPAGTEAERIETLRAARSLLKSVPDRDRLETVRALAAAVGPLAPADGAGGAGGATVLMLTWDQVRSMAGDGIEFGAHTVGHPILTRLSREEARREIVESKRRIEEVLGRRADHFAYPNGTAEDFTPEHEAIVAEAGFRSACSAIGGVNDGRTDRFALRRIAARDEPLGSFVRRLAEHASGARAS